MKIINLKGRIRERTGTENTIEATETSVDSNKCSQDDINFFTDDITSKRIRA